VSIVRHRPTAGRARRAIFALVALSLGVGCTAEVESEREALEDLTPELVDGKPTARFPAIGRLDVDFDGVKGICTATLVSKTAALTAAHCVQFGNGRADARREVRFVVGGRTHRAVEWRVFGFEYGPNDLALVRLGDASRVAPLPLVDGVPAGTSVWAVGYGPPRCRYDGASKKYQPIKRFVRFTWQNELPDLDVLCRGDSGGPIFTKEGGVFGVASAIRADAVDRSREDVFAHVAAARSSIDGWLDRWRREGR
jgi:hypothetical protein